MCTSVSEIVLLCMTDSSPHSPIYGCIPYCCCCFLFNISYNFLKWSGWELDRENEDRKRKWKSWNERKGRNGTKQKQNTKTKTLDTYPNKVAVLCFCVFFPFLFFRSLFSYLSSYFSSAYIHILDAKKERTVVHPFKNHDLFRASLQLCQGSNHSVRLASIHTTKSWHEKNAFTDTTCTQSV